MPSRSKLALIEQQVAIDYQKKDLLKQELDQIFGAGRYRINGIRLDYFHLSVPRKLQRKEIDAINSRMSHYKTQWEGE
ncbi:hypothetical protein CGCF415_v011735 [Colletotrichum fructicola]|uniref:Uncharacterized protein n=1 Tax=Colletotrichum fructicola (strain Nara gc5) TaxID=1213859 RepID=A0A7J6IQU7_COLFN|nr:uncharacterized protein CGMCC3_g3346 [Colletotrichum fructicola]KAF4479286.1 hypothetical protein CGGC5_v012639 [Colletotrichum fructicola Nara gc5]KAE9580620.1 hypothetical protein CGMCC3_g3346 [Colletotrichum fructicola]KAF4896048.1 hypothetical protein CGCF415_v011735 [Colletotrichum fructicola]KAF4900862.1 hypothetical protein CGCFRS4_v003089 [Colletotrichum fructicola]KAF4930256.1 hypothetical protein CGCF245_v011760 [Colletotrichum fructicola]